MESLTDPGGCVWLSSAVPEDRVLCSSPSDGCVSTTCDRLQDAPTTSTTPQGGTSIPYGRESWVSYRCQLVGQPGLYCFDDCEMRYYKDFLDGCPTLCENAIRMPVTDTCPVDTTASSLNPGWCCPVPTPTPTPECDPTGSEGCEFVMQSFCDCKNNGGIWNPTSCLCQGPSPIVIDTTGNGFSLTNAANGVDFDINGDDVSERLSWTSAGSDDVWLAMDRNGNSTIDDGTELFGNFTAQPEPPTGEERNGFLALAVFDEPANGGNSDGQIDRRDRVFNRLRLWRDTNQDGISDAGETRRLSDTPIRILELQYYKSRRFDEHGNEFRYRAIVRDQRGAQVGRWAWDVFLLSQ